MGEHWNSSQTRQESWGSILPCTVPPTQQSTSPSMGMWLLLAGNNTLTVCHLGRYLSHTELAPLRAPLIPMEHCTTRFFDACDLDNDKYIALEEWASCFGIKERKYQMGKE